MPKFKRIVVGTDFSEASRPALEVAAAMARESGGHLVVVHACEVPAYTEFAFAVDMVTPATTAANEQLGPMLEALRAEGAEVSGAVRIGAAWEEILDVAAGCKADLIVVGTHGRRGVAHAILGSVAERVVRLSPVPVLTVRAPSEERA